MTSFAQNHHRNQHGFQHGSSRYRSADQPLPEKNPPSNIVVLYGLNFAVDEHDIMIALRDKGADVPTEAITLLRDRSTKESRGTAFVTFAALPEAERFVSKFFPAFFLHGRHVRINYCKEDRSLPAQVGSDWNCPMCSVMNFKWRVVCFNCKAPRPAESVASAPVGINDGSHDKSTLPNHILIILGLDALTSEETIYAACSAVSPIENVALIRDRHTNASYCFCFMFYADIEAAQYALRAISMNPEFTIDGRPISASFASAASFTAPAIPKYPGETIYWDAQAIACRYPDVRPEIVAPIGPSVPPEMEQAKKLEDELADLYAELGDVLEPQAPKPSAEEQEPTIQADQPEPIPTIAAAPVTYSAPPQQLLSPFLADLMAAFLSDYPTYPRSLVLDAFTRLESLSNHDHFLCLLCRRQFESDDDLRRHTRESRLHHVPLHHLITLPIYKQMTFDAIQVLLPPLETKRQKKTRKSLKQAEYARLKGLLTVEEAMSMYESQVAVDDAVSEKTGTSKQLKNSIGHKMLQKMGWAEGEGLGKDKSGITVPIQAEQYSRGVGIGAGSSVPVTQAGTYSGKAKNEFHSRYLATLSKPK